MQHSTYASPFDRNGETYSGKRCSALKYYYQALRINVTVSGQHSISSQGSTDIHGFLYRDAFDPIDPSFNQIESNSGSCGNGQFRLQTLLQKNISYILVVTPLEANNVGPFSIVTIGAGSISFTRLSKFDFPCSH
jgi:hypothetical protein